MRFEVLGIAVLLSAVLLSACSSTIVLLYSDIDASEVIALQVDVDRNVVAVGDTISAMLTLTNLSDSRIAFNPQAMLRVVSVEPTPGAKDSIERHRDSIARLETQPFERCDGRGAQTSFTVQGIALDLAEEWAVLEPFGSLQQPVSEPYQWGYPGDARVLVGVQFLPIRSSLGQTPQLRSSQMYSDTLVVNIR